MSLVKEPRHNNPGYAHRQGDYGPYPEKDWFSTSAKTYFGTPKGRRRECYEPN